MIVPALAAAYLRRRPAAARRPRSRQLARRRRGDGRRQRRLAARRHALAGRQAVHRRQHGRRRLGPDPRLQRLRPHLRRGRGPAGGGASFGGAPGLWRMLNEQVGGQVAWLLPLALVGARAPASGCTRGAPRTDLRARRLGAVRRLGAGARRSCSAAQQGIFHPYYVSALAPAVAALAGAGVVTLWRWARTLLGRASPRSTPRCWRTACVAVALLHRTPDFAPWLRTAIPVAAALARRSARLALRMPGAARPPDARRRRGRRRARDDRRARRPTASPPRAARSTATTSPPGRRAPRRRRRLRRRRVRRRRHRATRS